MNNKLPFEFGFLESHLMDDGYRNSRHERAAQYIHWIDILREPSCKEVPHPAKGWDQVDPTTRQMYRDMASSLFNYLDEEI